MRKVEISKEDLTQTVIAVRNAMKIVVPGISSYELDRERSI